MLNREHLRLHRRADRALPIFADTANPDLLTAAESVLAVFRSGTGKCTRGELTEQLASITAAEDRADAFVKLAEGFCSFSGCSEMDYPELRTKIFAASGQLLRNAATPEELRKKLETETGLAEFLQQDIYGDLPENQRLVSFRDISAAELLERYNVAQVQGLLMTAKNLKEEAKLRLWA